MTEDSRLSKKEWVKNRIEFNQRLLEDLKQMKKEETESEKGIKDGRRRWFNREIESIKNKIQDLNNQLEKVAE